MPTSKSLILEIQCPVKSLSYIPMSRGSNEVQAAVHSAVWHLASVDTRLCVEVILKLTVDVIDDRLPAEGDASFM